MKRILACLVGLLWALCPTSAVAKSHVVGFGRSITAQVQPDDNSGQVALKVRPLLIDGKTKEFTTGSTHEVTDRTFVVQRVFRVNDSLPQESGPTRWRWEKGGWLLVDRDSGRIQQVALPEFDSYHSQLSWFRNYAAYCGISDDGQKSFAVVSELGKRRPLLKKTLGEGNSAGCPAPTWQRDPVRVTFATKDDPKLTFTVNSRFVDLAPEDESEGEE